MKKTLAVLSTCFMLLPLNLRADVSFKFQMMDGEVFDTAEFPGKVLLVANTASRCAYTRQYDELQALYDTYRDAGLTVLALPSNDFRQELATNEQVREFCAINFDLDVPMGKMIKIIGKDAHPFYRWLKAEAGFVPRWNFNKVLLSSDGEILGTWRAPISPTGPRITDAVEDALRDGQ